MSLQIRGQKKLATNANSISNNKNQIKTRLQKQRT